MPVTITHSYSALKLFDNCPKRYYHQRVAKDFVDQGGEASIHGNRIHTMMELRLRDGVVLPDEAKKYEQFCVAVEKIDGELFLEHKMSLSKDLTPSDYDTDETWLRSILDVFILGDDKAVIMDWKTGKRRPDFWQLELSVAQVMIHYPEVNTVNTAFVWLKSGEIDTERYTRTSLPRILERLKEKTDRIEEAVVEDVWPAKPSGLCDYCPVKNACTYAQKRWRR